MSYALKPDKVRDLLAAAGEAGRIGLPLTDHLIVHWEKMGIGDADAAAATTHLLKLIRQLCAARGHGFAAVWVREDDDGDGTKGAHLHCLLHIPPPIRRIVTNRFMLWLQRIAGRRYVKGAERLQRIGRLVGLAWSNPPLHAEGLAGILAYMAKGADRETAAALGLARHSEGGRVIGKRCGWTQNLGQKARAKRGRAIDRRKVRLAESSGTA